LDIWIWYSRFEDCYTGVTNTPGAGNYHVYNSVFRHSAFSDLAMGNTGGFSARGNYSLGSHAFFTSAGATNNPATIHLQRNTIVDPAESTAIRLGNQGPGVMTDNIIRSRPEARGPVVFWTSFFGADVASIGNTFTVADPIRSSGRLVSIDDRVVPSATINPVEPPLPPSRPNLRRRIFEVPRSADASLVQNVILAAAKERGSRPVVHFANATYSIAETLT